MQYWDNVGRPASTIGRVHYSDADPDGWDGTYRVAGVDGVAWRVFGWELESTEDTEWDGMLVRTGRLVAVMIGDDRPEVVDIDELEKIDELDYCAECGQIGCTHDGRER